MRFKIDGIFSGEILTDGACAMSSTVFLRSDVTY